MPKKAVYEPGELDKVKKRLGPIDEKEAKRIQKLLGGEIGEEKNTQSGSNESGRFTAVGRKGASSSTADASKPKRVVEVVAEAERSPAGNAAPRFYRRQNPLSYIERVKMDICAGSSQFGIKTMIQVLVSRFSFLKAPPDKVSQWFVKTNLNEYYGQIERLVTSTRLVFPRSNTSLSNKLIAASQPAFKILNTIRQWKLDVISSEIGKIQSHPRSVLVKDFEVILREIYRPLYIMENLDTERDIKGAFRTLYEILFMENPTKETERQQSIISEAVNSWQYVRFKLHNLLYPLLMKTIGEYYQDYELFFLENEENCCLFLGLTEADQIEPISMSINTKNLPADEDETENNDPKNDSVPNKNTLFDIDHTERETTDVKNLSAAEAKAVERGLQILETLFPQAPWSKFDEFPDFYPYFADVLEIKKNAELIAPEDPVHLTLILSQIIEELLYGFRYIKFVGAPNAESLNSIVDDWHTAISEAFEKKYLLRINEYAHYFEHASEKKNSTYALNIASDIHWIRRYYFLPHYDNTPHTPPSFVKKDVRPIYAETRRLRRDLSAAAAAIEAANKEGGSSNNTLVTGIENPWQEYNFQVENPLSKRLDMLLGKKQRNNMSLIFFTLAIATVLDSYLNDKNSIAYRADYEILFRSTGIDKLKPVFWVEKQNGTFAIFKKSIEDMRKKTTNPL